jgi:hypothetical protein
LGVALAVWAATLEHEYNEKIERTVVNHSCWNRIFSPCHADTPLLEEYLVRSGKPTDKDPPQAILQISAVDIAGKLRLILLHDTRLRRL